MPVIDKVLSRFGLARKDTPILNDGRGPSVRVSGGAGLGSAVWTTRDYYGYAKAGYQTNSDVYACISLIAAAGKQVKWWDDANGTKALTDRAELAGAVGRDLAEILFAGEEQTRARHLKLASNPRESIKLLTKAGGAAFIESWLSYILISGDAFIEIERNAAGAPSMLYLQRPDRVEANKRPLGTQAVQAIESELVESWRVEAYSQRRTVAPADMVHSKLFNPLDDIRGMAPLQAALLRVDAENEGLTLLKRMLQRGFSPGWIEAAKDSVWDDTQVAQLKERLKFSKAAGEELFLENAQWHQMGFSPVDSGVTEQQILSKRDIASVFHVPSQLVGDATTQTYSNYQEARRALYMEAVIPLLVQFRGDWNRKIGAEKLPDGTIGLGSPLDFDKDSFDAITAARQEATDRVVKLFTNGLITQPEGRDDLEYDAPKPGDVFYGPASLVPLDGGGKP